MPAPDFSSKLIRRHLAGDPVLKAIIQRHGPCTLTPVPTPPYRALCTAVVFQQLHAKAARTILGRVCALGKSKYFPSPDKLDQLSDAQLRGAGLSAAKTAAVRDIAAKTRDKTIPSSRAIMNMPDDEIIERCTEARGVGRWTVEMMLMFRLGRPDVLPVDDYGVRNGFRIAFQMKDMPTTKELAAYGERWKPWRTVAAWYMWRVADASKA
ncbi:MAG: DNA-3-methyladenine glycosylase [Planctomycetota bacterium]